MFRKRARRSVCPLAPISPRTPRWTSLSLNFPAPQSTEGPCPFRPSLHPQQSSPCLFSVLHLVETSFGQTQDISGLSDCFFFLSFLFGSPATYVVIPTFLPSIIIRLTRAILVLQPHRSRRHQVPSQQPQDASAVRRIKNGPAQAGLAVRRSLAVMCICLPLLSPPAKGRGGRDRGCTWRAFVVLR